MKRFVYCVYLNLFICFFSFFPTFIYSSVPTPDHVVVLVLENHGYQQVVGSAAAPYINGLLSDPQCALFTQSYGLSHPSQPNYIQLFAGSNLGVVDNNVPDILPFTSRNLGASLLAAGRTFTGYSEDLPSVGATDSVSGQYARKHNPWVNWQGGSLNGLPASCNQPFTAFPSNYALLPTVSFVVPNLTNDMHNGSDPTRITTCDTWIQNNLNAYIQWAKTHNSLLILTFDEDDDVSNQHILTFIIGEHVLPGSYSTIVDHYNVLRTLEDMYSLPHAGAAATAAPIDYCWTACHAGPRITASGSLAICPGASVTLTSSAGINYLWSTGATTSSISVSNAGSYTVTVTDAAGCTATSQAAVVSILPFSSTGTVFTESMGTVSATTAISTHEANNGFDNDSYTMSGTGDVRSTTASSGYIGASGLANIFLTNTVGKNFIISGINTSGMTGLALSFGVYKSTTASTGSELQVLVSSDGTNYSSLSFAALGSSATWYYRTASGTIPSVSNLWIQFRQNGSTPQFRIDDVQLTYQVSVPVIAAVGPTTFCQGGSVLLTSSLAPAYTWSNGATTSSISVNTTGNYYVAVSSGSGCPAISNVIPVTVNSPPTISSFTPAIGSTGTSVTVNGNYFSGTTSVKLNGNSMAYTIVSTNQITFTVPAGSSSGSISIVTPCGTATSVSNLTIISSVFLNLHVYIQGYYLGSGLLNTPVGAGICDTLIVDLHNSTAPYAKLISDTSTINSSGNGVFVFPGIYVGGSYFLGIRHRNSIETWTASPVVFSSSSPTYDFTTSINQAFGANEVLLPDGNAALYSGDITQDGLIGTNDISTLENFSQQFLSGYLQQDLTGDQLVESGDFSLLENNSQLFIVLSRP